MERLTRKSQSSEMVWFIDHDNNGLNLEPCEMSYSNNGKAIRKLAHYEDAEEQGRLVILPCKIGTPIFIIGNKYRSGKVDKWINTGKFRLSDIEKLGKTVFLTREEAEVALNKIKGD